jgi:hypothetical protein
MGKHTRFTDKHMNVFGNLVGDGVAFHQLIYNSNIVLTGEKTKDSR